MLTLKFKAITPVFIGSGEVLEQGFHYTVKNEKFLKYSEKVVIAYLADHESFDLINSGKSTVDILKKKIAEISPNTPDLFEYGIALSTAMKDYFAEDGAKAGKNSVREFINSNGNFYIPGSTIKGCLNTLFEPEKLRTNSINGRFLIYDSDPLSNEKFEVDEFEWFPYQSFIVLKKDSEFTISIPKSGFITKTNLEERIRSYFESQVKNAKIKLSENAENNQKNLTELDKFLKDNKDYNQMLVNLGYGGGSWFKMNKGESPTISAKKGESLYKIHIGWCSVEVEEC